MNNLHRQAPGGVLLKNNWRISVYGHAYHDLAERAHDHVATTANLYANVYAPWIFRCDDERARARARAHVHEHGDACAHDYAPDHHDDVDGHDDEYESACVRADVYVRAWYSYPVLQF